MIFLPTLGMRLYSSTLSIIMKSKKSQKGKKEQPERPQTLSAQFVRRVVSSKGRHYGITQIASIGSKKRTRFYMVVISDGYYTIKISFIGEAARLIQESNLEAGSVIEGYIEATTIQNTNIYTIKEIQHSWGKAEMVGNPNGWKFNKINSYQNKEIEIVWEEKGKQGREVEISGKSKSKSRSKKKVEESDSESDQESQQQPRRSKRIPKLREEKFQKKSKERQKSKSKSKSKPKDKEKEEVRERSERRSVTPKKKSTGRKKKSVKNTPGDLDEALLKALDQFKDQQTPSFKHENSKTPNNKLKQPPGPAMTPTKSGTKRGGRSQSELFKQKYGEEIEMLLNSSATPPPNPTIPVKPSPGKHSKSKETKKQKGIDELDNEDLENILKSIQQGQSRSHETLLSGSKFNMHSLSNKKEPPPISVSIRQEIAEQSLSVKVIKPPLITQKSMQRRQDQKLLRELQGMISDEQSETQPIDLAKANQNSNQNGDEIDDEELESLMTLMYQNQTKEKKQKGTSAQQSKRSKFPAITQNSSSKASFGATGRRSKAEIQNNKLLIQPSELFIEDLHSELGTNWVIKVMLSCLYTPKQPDFKKPLAYAIFVDKNGDYIQARIPLKLLILQTLHENQFYEVSKVSINISDDIREKGTNAYLEFNPRTQCTATPPIQIPCSSQNIYLSLRQIQDNKKQWLDKTVNIVAIVKDVDRFQYRKGGQTKPIVTFTLIDPILSSQTKITIFSNDFLLPKCAIVALFNLKITLYKGEHQLSFCKNTIVSHNTQLIPKAIELEEYCNPEFLETFIVRQYLKEVSIEQLRQIEEEVVAGNMLESHLKGQLIGKLQFYNKNTIYYLSCPNCRKKMSPTMNNEYRCSKCQKTMAPLPKYMISGDFYSGSQKIRVILDEKLCTKIIGVPASKLFESGTNDLPKDSLMCLSHLDEIVGKQVRAEVIGSYKKEKVSYSIRYLETVKPKEQFPKLLDEIRIYMNA